MNMASNITSPTVSVWHSRRLWLALIVISLAATFVAFKLMFNVLPALKTNITFTREQAIESAEQLQQKLFPEIKTNRIAVAFGMDRNLQTYVELEAGGIDVFKQHINNPDVAPYAWNIRRFAESQEQEVWISYTQNGDPLKFSLKIPEKDPGAALSADEARVIAEAGAHDFLGERFNAYKAFDTKFVRQSSGRVDHTFIYEHDSLKLGEASFRIELIVAGDKLVSINPYNHIPDAFNQRFNEMRATNNQIGQIADYLMKGLLFLCGVLGGGYWLHKYHQLKWRNGFMPAVVVAGGIAASMMCNLPMAWMSYNTTVSANIFLLQQFAAAGITMVIASLLFASIYAVAEGLSRMAFADHPRLFDFFRQPVAATEDAYGRVLGGYIWAGFFLLYAMLFVLLSRNVFGWWMPVDLEVDPNILASLRPALGPIFTALQAGTWEECLFRAIPLAAASLIGSHYGIRKPLLIFALIAQAFIFGAAHAGYPNFPGYSRLVELFIPAIVFGLVYLRFGLVSGILTHFIYDLVLMSMPIFNAADSSLLIDKCLVVLAGSLPLLILFYARYRAGALTILAPEWRNGKAIMEIENNPVVIDEPQSISAQHKNVLFSFRVNPLWVIGLLVLTIAGWGAVWKKTSEIEWPAFQVDRAEALHLAQIELEKQGVILNDEWRSTVLTTQGWGRPRDFIWRESDKATFQSLIGRFLDAASWEVTWRKFGGPVEQRTEQWIVMLRPDGSLYDLIHDLPESAAGARLTREQAVEKAKQWIIEHHWAEANQLEEKSAEEMVRPNRSDWRVTFLDKTAFDHNNGQAFIKITFNGDAVTASLRSIDVPQEWQRVEAEKQSQKTPYSMASGIALFVLILLALSSYIRKYQGGKFNLRITVPWLVIISGSMIIDAFLWIDTSTSNFQTTMNWSSQLWTVLAWKFFYAALFGIATAVMLQSVYAVRPSEGSSVKNDVLLGGSLALILAILHSLIMLFLPSDATPGANTGDFASYVPWLSTTINATKTFYMVTAFIIFVVGLVRFNKSRLHLMLIAGLVVIWWICSAFAADDVGLSLGHKLITLLSMIILGLLIARQQFGVAIAMLGIGIALERNYLINAVYPSAWVHVGIAMIVTVLITYGLVWHWYRQKA